MAVSNSLQKREDTMKLSVYLNQEKIKNSIIANAGSKINGEQVIANILSVVTVNPDIQNCDFTSVISGGLIANSLKLSLSPAIGHCCLVPFKEKDKQGNVKNIKATFILEYKGYIQLAMRSGYYKKMNAFAIKEGELIEYNPFEESIVLKYTADEIEREKKKTVGYYAFFEYTNGFKKLLYWTKDKMLIHADKYSPAFNMKTAKLLEENKIPKNELWKYSSFWYKDFDEMALKTMLRQLISKWGIMSIEMQQAFNADNDFTETKTDNNFTPTDFFDDSNPNTEESVAQPEVPNSNIIEGDQISIV